MATRSRILAWAIPGIEEPGRLQYMELQRVGHDLATEHTHTLTHRVCIYLFILRFPQQKIFGNFSG